MDAVMICERWSCQKRVAVNGCIWKYEHMSPVFANGDFDGDIGGDSNDVSDVDALVEGYANDILG